MSKLLPGDLLAKGPGNGCLVVSVSLDRRRAMIWCHNRLVPYSYRRSVRTWAPSSLEDCIQQEVEARGGVVVEQGTAVLDPSPTDPQIFLNNWHFSNTTFGDVCSCIPAAVRAAGYPSSIARKFVLPGPTSHANVPFGGNP